MKIAINITLGLLVCVAVVFVALKVVAKQDPVASLSEASFSKRYTSAFWAKEHSQNSDLWSRALSLCSEQAKSPKIFSPNCAVVGVVADDGAQERLAREELAERGKARAWLQNGQTGEVSNGLSGHGARGVPSGFGPPRGAAE